MAYSDGTIIRIVAIVALLSGLIVMVRGSFFSTAETIIMLMLVILLGIAVYWQKDDAISYFLFSLFFIAMLANSAYTYSISGYFSMARLGALVIAVIGLIWSVMDMLLEPIPHRIAPNNFRAEVRNLIAAEKKISEAKETLRKVEQLVPAKDLKAKKKLRRKKGKNRA
jgi:hypothetical protein